MTDLSKMTDFIAHGVTFQRDGKLSIASVQCGGRLYKQQIPPAFQTLLLKTLANAHQLNKTIPPILDRVEYKIGKAKTLEAKIFHNTVAGEEAIAISLDLNDPEIKALLGEITHFMTNTAVQIAKSAIAPSKENKETKEKEGARKAHGEAPLTETKGAQQKKKAVYAKPAISPKEQQRQMAQKSARKDEHHAELRKARAKLDLQRHEEIKSFEKKEDSR